MPHSSFMTRLRLFSLQTRRFISSHVLFEVWGISWLSRANGVFGTGRFQIRKCNQVLYSTRMAATHRCKRNTICSLLDERCRLRDFGIVPEQQLILSIRMYDLRFFKSWYNILLEGLAHRYCSGVLLMKPLSIVAVFGSRYCKIGNSCSLI